MLLDPQPHQQQFLDCNGTEDSDPIRIVFFGGGAGGGKTWSILVDNLYGIHDPDYLSVFFRKTTKELDTNLWPEAKKMYQEYLFDENGKPYGKAHIAEKDRVITFPSGAKSIFSYLQHEKDADAYYGSELAKVYIDELQMHSQYSFDVLRSRNRSRAKTPKGMRFTLNPDADHWMYEWIKPFLLSDDSGFPDKGLAGKTRYFVIINGETHSSWDKQELFDKYGKKPQTYTYVPATLEQNKVLQELDPDYFDVLDSMPEAKRNQLLLGCWKKLEDSGLYYNRDWIRKSTHVPVGSVYARGWDTAGGVPDPSRGYDPDYTVGVKMAKSPDGLYYICGMERFREMLGVRDTKIMKIAKNDGRDCTTVMPQDVGAAGKFQYQEFAKKSTKEGIICKPDPMPNNKSKLLRYEPFSVACQNGLVFIVESGFESKEDIEQFHKENESFIDARSTRTRRDDIPDAGATVFNYLSKEDVIPDFSLPELKQSNPFNIYNQ